ncbi:carbohydrate kinase family protein [Embleya hyalina]|uniref:Carbohydrate kinase n=1 Tax=Embleya hyalina TaxID=516124 RepID=A0A401Z5S8_9ACTN|nr:carbohydrate kinase family protein [Embleya hyalina]GCE02203.1 carbohydrate kinase [Embleya hyalina]
MSTNGSAPRRDVLVAGAYFADLVFHALQEPVRQGGEVFAEGFALVPGGAYTLAMAVHRLGHDVLWSTDFGTDPFSAQVLSAARSEGLDETGFRHHPRPVRCLTVSLSGFGDRAMVSYLDRIDPRPLGALLREHRPRVLMLPQLRWDAGTLAALRVARRLGTVVVMDCQDVAAGLDDAAVRRALALVDVFVPNLAEALRLTGTVDLDDALAELSALVPTVVVKRGGDGATAVWDGRRHDVPAVPVDVVDTTGAGDCFNAGFVHGLLGGRSVADSLAFAVACGAAATTAPGSAAALRADRLSHWLDRGSDTSHTCGRGCAE